MSMLENVFRGFYFCFTFHLKSEIDQDEWNNKLNKLHHVVNGKWFKWRRTFECVQPLNSYISVVFVKPKYCKEKLTNLHLTSVLNIITLSATVSRSVFLVTDPLHMYISISMQVLTVMKVWFVNNVMSCNIWNDFLSQNIEWILQSVQITKLRLIAIYCPNPNSNTTQPNPKLGLMWK